MDQGHAGLAFVLWLVLAGGSNAWAAVREPPPTSEACLACHSDPDLKKELEKGRVVSLFVDAAHLARSPHKGFTCVQCHADIREVPHTQPPATPGVEVCQGCHQKAVAEYRESAHWGRIARGETGAPTCRSCHGPAHGILSSRDPASPTYHLNLPRTCAQCHADPELVRRYNIPGANVYLLYMDSIHGRALTRSGLLVAANCSDCHGHHDIRRRTDPAARVYRTNIPGTCGRCHAGLREQYEQGVHGIAVKGGNTVAPV
ncbi:MAG: hypothetical protein HYY85_07270, partial [Deltaproteobacteria bacterium]|nr:hypothetical protein [Deltaproteobacteria bacterium]